MKKSFVLVILLVSLTACGGNSISSNYSSISDSSVEDSSSSVFVPSITNLKAETTGHYTEPQLNYLKSENYSDTTPYNGNMSVSKPLPVHISWECDAPGPYKVEISPVSFASKLVYETNETSFDFYNPLLNTDYEVVVSKDNQTSKTTFNETITVSGPRSLFIDGVENFRDVGGYGKFVEGVYQPYMKQGMIYRSGRFNADKKDSVEVTISESGIKEMVNHLKIKTEIDLRRTSNNEVGSLTDKSVLGDTVNYIQIPMAFGGKNILTFQGKLSGDDYDYDNPAMIKRFFELLADKNNYPINFHCSIGKDRTGCMAYLIEGLLGFSQEDAYRDYMFTNYADAGMCKMSDITDRYGPTIDNYENGSSFQEKVYNYLHEVIDVSKENLDTIINLLKY